MSAGGMRYLPPLIALAVLSACGGASEGTPERISRDELFEVAHDAAVSELRAEGNDEPATLEHVELAIDERVQDALQDAITRAGPRSTDFVAAGLVVDVETGLVVGAAATRGDPFQYIDAQRRSGSTLKIVVLTAAVALGAVGDDGITSGVNCYFPDEHLNTTLDPSPGAVVTLRDATERSSNCAFAKLARIAGPSQIRTALDAFGLDRDLALRTDFAIGANTVSLRELSQMMMILLSGDESRRVRLVDHAPPDAPAPLGEHANHPALTRRTASDVLDVLSGVSERGTASGHGLPNRRSAGKTGTADRSTDAWFVGGTKEYVAAVWVGDPDDPDASMSGNAIPGHESVAGGTIPAEIWARTMATILDGRPESWDFEPTAARQPVILVDPTVDCLDPSAAPPASGPEPRLPHLASITDGITCSPPPG